MNFTTAMVIDDSEADQMLAKMELEEFRPGIEIIQAYDGREALQILGELDKQPDIIFLDINMPNMNGHQFLAEYSKHDVQSTVVAMLTSSDQTIDKEEALKYKCVKKYFVKYINGKDLATLSELEDIS